MCVIGEDVWGRVRAANELLALAGMSCETGGEMGRWGGGSRIKGFAVGETERAGDSVKGRKAGRKDGEA